MRKFKGSSDFLSNASPDQVAPRGEVQREGADERAGTMATGHSDALDSSAVLQCLDEFENGATRSGLAKKLGTEADAVDVLLAQLARDRLVEEKARSGTAESLFSLSAIGQRAIRYRKMARF